MTARSRPLARSRARPLLEVCVESFDDALVAIAGGADRIEYCSALAVGGLTPTPGALMRLREISAPCMVMIRPRPGHFIFDGTEIEIMKREIEFARDCGAAGIVIGAAKPDGTLDRDALADLLSVCAGVQTTLHRVFDATPDPFEALDTAIDLGFDRILTSGQRDDALAGSRLIGELIEKSAGRLEILPGAGVTADNAVQILNQTGAGGLHASCKIVVTGRGYAAGRVATDIECVRALKIAMA